MPANGRSAARLRTGLALIFGAALFVYALWPWLPGKQRFHPHTIVCYGFSILGEVMNQGIFPAFQSEWKRKTGEQVEFVSSFAGSGTITNQILLGVPADIALLALELDAERLAEGRATSPESWRSLPFHGVVNRTPFVIVVRPGNPKGIHDFSDLARPGIRIVHPDPLTSGGANWAIVAEYGSAYRQSGGSVAAGHQLLLGIWRNVVAQAASARAARTQFENGFGDALITYEQDVVGGRSGAIRGEVVYPHSTVLSEHTVVLVNRNISPSRRPLIDAFLRFLWSDEAQRIFVHFGFRSVDYRWNQGNTSFGKIADPFFIADFGGWKKAKAEIIDGIWKNRVLQELKP
jgi:sulfate transport system substrate-binding protein